MSNVFDNFSTTASRKSGDPVWINTTEMLARARDIGPEALSIAMDVFCTLALGGRQAFTFDPKVIARVASRPQHACSVERVLSLKSAILKMFVARPDGRYMADPDIFSVTPPCEEAE